MFGRGKDAFPKAVLIEQSINSFLLSRNKGEKRVMRGHTSGRYHTALSRGSGVRLPGAEGDTVFQKPIQTYPEKWHN